MANEDSLAPIAVIAFNRPDLLKATLDSLAHNPLADKSDLYVFVDGPREGCAGEAEKVKKVVSVAESASGFKSVSTRISETNQGLAKSVIDATSALLDQDGRVIVVEDDLFVSPCFLTYMNMMLDAYENDSRVMQVTGYSARIRHHERYRCDHYLTRRAHSWSWATWKDRWETVDWEVKDFDELAANKNKRQAFNEYGSDLFGMLKAWKTGEVNSWFIRFCYAMHKQGRFAVAPIRSLVRNDGFGTEATNCKSYNRYIADFQEVYKDDWDVSSPLEWNKKLDKESVRYWSIPYRIYGKIRTMLSFI